MFPFNLTGPQFLAFYVVFAGVVLVAYLYRASRPASPAGAGRARIDSLTSDPYRIGCLRDGPDEAVRLAIVNLIDRDLLVAAKGTALRATLKAQPAVLRRALERVIVARCTSSPLSPQDILADPQVRAAAAEIEEDLQRHALLLTPDERAGWLNAKWCVGLLLAGVALARIAQALSQGRTNIVFLIILAVIACILATRLPKPRITRAGRQALSNLQTLMRQLKDRASRLAPGGATNEAMLLAAVFGIYALPVAAFPFVEEHFPKPRPQSDSGGGSSDSGGGSSDSGGCGGGGGGCGGCGGGD